MEWKSIESAPKDGRPVWVKGNDFGEEKARKHCLWAYWDVNSDVWREASVEASILLYLTHWMPITTPAEVKP